MKWKMGLKVVHGNKRGYRQCLRKSDSFELRTEVRLIRKTTQIVRPNAFIHRGTIKRTIFFLPKFVQMDHQSLVQIGPITSCSHNVTPQDMLFPAKYGKAVKVILVL